VQGVAPYSQKTTAFSLRRTVFATLLDMVISVLERHWLRYHALAFYLKGRFTLEIAAPLGVNLERARSRLQTQLALALVTARSIQGFRTREL
jgi:hypothetical protein